MALGSREDLRGFAHGIPDVPEPAASALRTRSGTLLERAAAMLHDAWTRTESIAVMSIAIESATGPLAPLQQSKLESRAIDRLRQCLRDGDAIGRQGESGLLAVIGGAKTSYAAAIVAGRLIEQLKDPIHVDGVATPVRMNIGIAVYPYDDHQLGGLLEHARFARATAQGAGPNRFSLAETSLNRSVASDPIEWDERLRLGSPELDAQHLEMVWLLGELQHDAMSVAALAGLEEKFETLLRCLQADFVAEERMMTGLPTSRSEAHRSEHRRILHKLACLRHADLAQSTALRVRVLSEWFTAHIPDFDAEMLGGG
jgi:hemerythrin-like metal-binding protein